MQSSAPLIFTPLTSFIYREASKVTFGSNVDEDINNMIDRDTDESDFHYGDVDLGWKNELAQMNTNLSGTGVS